MRQENKQIRSLFSRRHFIKAGGISVAAFGGLAQILSSSPQAGSEFKNMAKKVKPLEQDDYVMRLQKAQKAMKKNHIDALLLTGGTNLNYFVNLSWWRSERFFGMFLGQKGDPIWICPAFELHRAQEKIKYGTDIRTWEEHETPY